MENSQARRPGAGESGQQALQWHNQGILGTSVNPDTVRDFLLRGLATSEAASWSKGTSWERNHLSLFVQGSALDWSAILVGQNRAPETRLRRTHPSGNTRKFLRRVGGRR